MTHEAIAQSRESRALVGRAYRRVLFANYPITSVRRMRGPALARFQGIDNRQRANPFADRTRPLRVMLDPTMDYSNVTVKNVLKLASYVYVVEFFSISPDTDFVSKHIKRVRLRQLEHVPSGENWCADFEQSRVRVSMINDYRGIADYFFGPLDSEMAHLLVLTGQTAKALRCDFFLSSNSTLLERRYSATGWGTELGSISPLELLHILAVLFRLADFLPTSEDSTVSGGVYETTIQERLPSYLPLYRSLCHSGAPDVILDYLDGLLGGCAQSLMALDRLASLHYAEEVKAANNTTVHLQQYEAATLVVGATASLESLTWVLLKLAGVEANPHRVTFRRLLDEYDKPWVKTIIL